MSVPVKKLRQRFDRVHAGGDRNDTRQKSCRMQVQQFHTQQHKPRSWDHVGPIFNGMLQRFTPPTIRSSFPWFAALGFYVKTGAAYQLGSDVRTSEQSSLVQSRQRQVSENKLQS